MLNKHHIEGDREYIEKLFESKKQEGRSDSTVTSIQSSCPYCSILGYNISFNNTGLLKEHVVETPQAGQHILDNLTWKR